MAVLEDSVASPSYSEFRDWRRDENRNIRSNAKAERILGISEPNGQYGQEKKRTIFNFSLLNLRTVIPGLSRKSSRCRVEMKVSDSDSFMSTYSPTFDPSTSTTSLNTIDSSPTISKRRVEQSHMQTKEERLSQAETLGTKKIYMPSSEEAKQLSVLASLNMPPSSPKSKAPTSYSGRRKRSNTSLSSLRSDLTTQGYRHVQATEYHATSVSHPVEPVLVPAELKHPEKDLQDWFKSKDFKRRPPITCRSSSLMTRRPIDPLYLPMSQGVETLHSEIKGEGRSVAATPPQWPLPATKIKTPPRLRRIHRSNLMVESVLSLSSDDEDSDIDTKKQRSSQSSVRNSKSSCTSRSELVGHKRHESTASSVIQLDSRPRLRSISSAPLRTFPKRSLADIAAEGAYRPNSCDSRETDIVAEMDILATAFEEKVRGQDLVPSPVEVKQTSIHPLWRSSRGSFDVDIRVSRSGPSLRTLSEVEIAKPTKLSSEEDEVDVSSFPIPPRSRSASLVPCIQVYNIGEPRKSAPPAIVEYPEGDVILLSPSITSRPTSLESRQSPASSKSSQDPSADFAGRKRAASNAPSYFIGLESPMTDKECGDRDVKSYISSSMF